MNISMSNPDQSDAEVTQPNGLATAHSPETNVNLRLESLAREVESTVRELVVKSFLPTTSYLSKANYYLDPERVSVTQDGNGSLTLTICFANMHEDSSPFAEYIPLVYGYFLKENIAQPNEITIETDSFKDYDWMCYSGIVTAKLPNTAETLATIKDMDPSNITTRGELLLKQSQVIEILTKKLGKEIAKMSEPDRQKWKAAFLKSVSDTIDTQ